MRRIVATLPLMLVALYPLGAAAQACLGVPQGTGAAVTASLSFPANATGFTASGVTAAGDHLYGVASAGLVAPDVEGAENVTQLGLRAAYQLPSLLETASVCPSVGLGYSTFGDINSLSVPFGVGIGSTLPLNETSTITPYATPQLVWTRVTVDDVDGSASETSFALDAGATVGFGRFLAGAFIGKVFEGGSDAVLGVTAGFAF